MSISNTCSLDSGMSLTSQNSDMRKMLSMNEDEALKIILANVRPENLTPSRSLPDSRTTASTSSDDNINMKSPSADEGEAAVQEPTLGNSLNRRSGGWSFDETSQSTPKPPETVVSPPNVEMNRSLSSEDRSMEHSYHALIESYNLLGGSFVKTPNLQEVWQRLEDKSVGSSVDESSEDAKEPTEETYDPEDLQEFEFVTASSLSKNQIRLLLSHLGKLAQEKGLDEQNFECYGCKHPLGINVCKSRVCAFSGNCFCDSCMSPDPIVIPSRVIHNWDFKQYHVCKTVATFISEVKNHPLLDMKVQFIEKNNMYCILHVFYFQIFNPYIYVGVEEMSRLQNIRIQLNFLRDYLYTCRGPVIEQLQRLVWPKEYMYEHIHQYSISVSKLK